MPSVCWKRFIIVGLIGASSSVFAIKSPMYEQLQVPKCLAEKMPIAYDTLAENKEFKIITLPAKAIDGLAVLAEQLHCGHFINVSHKLQTQSAATLLAANYPKHLKTDTYPLMHQKQVQAALEEIVPDNIWSTLTHLTSYKNRSPHSNMGVAVAQWLQDQFVSMATEYDRHDTDHFFVQTGHFKQPSLVTVIGKDLKGPAVVIGAHMDTLDGYMPGAGDDGSGSASIMEAARVLLASKTPLKHPVYIIWYAAEEQGLVGSQYVVEHFLDKSIPVRAVMQFDMTGYRVKADDPTIWVYKDYTDKSLSNFTTQLIDAYIHVPVNYSYCGYGCSDHVSWTQQGIPAAFPCESNFEDHNPYIHTSADTMDLLSLEHMTNFSKLALAFVIELSA